MTYKALSKPPLRKSSLGKAVAFEDEFDVQEQNANAYHHSTPLGFDLIHHVLIPAIHELSLEKEALPAMCDVDFDGIFKGLEAFAIRSPNLAEKAFRNAIKKLARYARNCRFQVHYLGYLS